MITQLPNCYVYILRRNDIEDPFCLGQGLPFYVGKGSNQRAFLHHVEAKRENISTLKTRYINYLWDNGIDFEPDIITSALTKFTALSEEFKIIKIYGCLMNKTGILTNIYGSNWCSEVKTLKGLVKLPQNYLEEVKP